MNSSITRISIALIILLSGVSLAEEMPEADNITITATNDTITLNAVNADLVDLIRMLADHAEMNVVIDPDVSGRATVNLRNIALHDALRIILQSNGYAVDQRGPVTRVLRAELVKSEMIHEVFQLKATTIPDVQPHLQELLSPGGKMILQPQRNSFMVIDTPEVMARVQLYLESADARERQVMIRARLVEVSRDRSDAFGFEWTYLDTNIKQLSNAAGTITQSLIPDNLNAFGISLANTNFESTFRALITEGNVNLLSAPTIATVNNQEARVEITEDIPYIESTTTIESAAPGGSTTSTQSIEFVTVGVKLTVLPQIGQDDIIKIRISPEVSEAPVRFQNIPVVKKRVADTTLLVQNGQTIALGGLIRENSTEQVRRVPILSSIPLLGNLFKSSERTMTKVELIIFITPYIMDDAVAAEIVQEGDARLNALRESKQ